MTHQEFVNKLLKHLSIAGCRVWANQTGVAQTLKTGHVIRYGLKGSADITGIISGGKRIEIECKVGKDFLKPEQINFRKMIESLGGIYIVARNIDETVDEINNLIKVNNGGK